MSTSFADQLAVDHVDADLYISRTLPQHVANPAAIAYGGYTVAVAIHAACKTVTPNFYIFSVLGSFLGPTATDRQIHCRVTQVRNTKTFATRQAVTFQIQDDGSERMGAHILIDFHVTEPALLTYNQPALEAYGTGPDDQALPSSVILERSARDGLITPAVADAYSQTFSLINSWFQINQCTAGVSAQNAIGMAKHAKTTQDQRPIHDKTAAEWTRVKEPLNSYMENAAALGFLMDGGLSFLPLHLDHKDFDDAGACSTLDFAMRIMVPEIHLNAWTLKERKTIAASGGRTYSEQKLWSQDGQLVAIMSQTCILRPPVRRDDKKVAKL